MNGVTDGVISEDGTSLTVGGGNKPNHKIEEVVSLVRNALFLVIEVFTEVVRHYAELTTEGKQLLVSSVD